MTNEQKQRLEEIRNGKWGKIRTNADFDFLLSLIQEPALTWKGNELFVGRICVGRIYQETSLNGWFGCYFERFNGDWDYCKDQFDSVVSRSSELEARAYLEAFVREQFSGEQITNG